MFDEVGLVTHDRRTKLVGDVLLGKYGRGGWSLGDKVEYMSLLMTPHFGRL
jgi:hypothetical protein